MAGLSALRGLEPAPAPVPAFSPIVVSTANGWDLPLRSVSESEPLSCERGVMKAELLSETREDLELRDVDLLTKARS